MWLSAGCGELRAETESNNLGGMCDEFNRCWWQSLSIGPLTMMTATTTAAKVMDDDNSCGEMRAETESNNLGGMCDELDAADWGVGGKV